MTCAKTRVFAIILCDDGRTYTGSNDCLEPQRVCPRAPGEGYAKCISICRQPGHAEMVAIGKAIASGSPVVNAKLYVFGNVPCVACRDVMDRAQITYEVIP